MMKKNLVAMMVTVVMVAGALVGCGSKEVAQETTPVVEATVEASVEENAVDAAASTEGSVVEETVVEELEPQVEKRKVLAGYIRLDASTQDVRVYSNIYDEFGNPVKRIRNDNANEEFQNIIMSEELSASDFMNFGEKYVYEYAEVAKSENGMILEMDWYEADGTNSNAHFSYTYNEFGSELTEVGPEVSIEYTFDENGYLVGEHDVNVNGNEYTTTADEITSEVDEDGTIIYKAYSNTGVEYYYYYTTIEVPVQ